MTDEKIVALYWARAEDAIAETEKRYGRYIRYITYNILLDHNDSEEITNDTYLKAWNTIPPAKPDQLKTYLGRIARQLSINRLEAEHAKKRNNGQYQLAMEELEECIPDPSEDSDLAQQTALRDSINHFLRALPVEQRRVFLKRYWYMCSVSQISNELSISESKTKSMLMRTREKLKQHLNKEGFYL